MENKYIKGLGVYVGTFNEQDLKENKDKQALEKVQEKTGLQYTNTKLVMKRKEIIGIKIYACSSEDFKIQPYEIKHYPPADTNYICSISNNHSKRVRTVSKWHCGNTISLCILQDLTGQRINEQSI